MALTQKDLEKAYKILHDEKKFRGLSALKFTDEIAALVLKHDTKSILDYGCGAGMQYEAAKMHNAWGGLYPALYDPYVEEFSAKPSDTYEGVICTDVLEHLPKEDILDVVRDILELADKWVFFTVCPRKANKTLPDGRNAHLTVEPLEWWQKRIHEIVGECEKHNLDIRIEATE